MFVTSKNLSSSTILFGGRVDYTRLSKAMPGHRASAFLQSAADDIEKATSIDAVRKNRKAFYDSTGRTVLGNQADLILAAQEVRKEISLYQNNPEFDTNPRLQRRLAKAEARLSDIELAQIDSEAGNPKAKERLGKALQKLQDLYGARSDFSPALVQGYATLGTYTLDHDVFQNTKRQWGSAKMAEEEATFEGMGIEPSTDLKQRRKHRNAIKDDLAFLENAIMLSGYMKGDPSARALAKADYLTRKGEANHALAHLYLEKEEDWTKHSQRARDAFKEAIDILQGISNQTPLGKYILKKLKEEKAPHLCDSNSPHTERTYPQDARDSCGALARQGVDFRHVPFWKRKYGGLEVSEVRRLREMEQENNKLKRIVANLMLENEAIKEVLSSAVAC